MKGLGQDFRYAVRMLAKNPTYTALAVLMLAIGIGVNSIGFGIVDGLFLRSMPVQNPEQLVRIYSEKEGKYPSFSYPEYEDLCRSRSFTGILAADEHFAELERDGGNEMISAELVSDNYFSVLGIKPFMGRSFSEKEDFNVNGDAPVIISYGLWQKRFGSDPKIIGKAVVINRRSAVIRGVAPASYVGLRQPMVTEIWLPASRWLGPEALHTREEGYLGQLLGRLNPGVNLEEARAELNTVAHRLAKAYPATNQGVSYSLNMAEKDFISSFMLAAVLLSGPFLILMICCANVSGIGLAKSEERRNEIAVRLALGSGTSRILRQLLCETLLLSAVGAFMALILTYWLIRLQPALLPPLPFSMRFDLLQLDWSLFLFTLAVSIAASLVSGLPVALRTRKAGLAELLKSKTGEAKKYRFGLRDVLISSQVAVSLVLLVATGLFLKSLLLSTQIDPGFDTNKKLLIVGVVPMMNPRESNQKFFLPVLNEVRSVPGVENITYARRMILSSSGGGVASEVSIPGVENPPGQKGFSIKYNSVGRDYFRIVGTAIRKGRGFDRSDELPGQRTVIINETMAKRFWPDAEPIGRFITRNGTNYQIIGVAEDGRINKLHETPESYIYYSFAQVPASEVSIIVETTKDPLELAAAVRNKIREVDRSVAFLFTDTLKKEMDLALYGERLAAIAAGILGCLGIILTAIGLYGIVSYLARRRTHEIGIRIAVGAQFRDIHRLVIARGFKTSLIGIAAGLIISFYSMRLISTILYGVAPTDPWMFAAGALVALAVSLLASYIPARRATKTDPVTALRCE